MFTLRGKGLEPRIAHAAEEHQTQMALVAAGIGVAVSPRLGRGPVPPGVRVVPVRQPMRRHVYAAWRTDTDRRPSVRAAVAALRRAGHEVARSAATLPARGPLPRPARPGRGPSGGSGAAAPITWPNAQGSDRDPLHHAVA